MKSQGHLFELCHSWMLGRQKKTKNNNSKRNCRSRVLDFDLSKQRCSPSSTSGRSDSKSSGADEAQKCWSFDMRSWGQVFDGLGRRSMLQKMTKTALQTTLSKEKWASKPLVLCLCLKQEHVQTFYLPLHGITSLFISSSLSLQKRRGGPYI